MQKKCLSCGKPHLDIGDDGLCTECSYDQYISNKTVSNSNFYMESLRCLITVRVPSFISERYNRVIAKITKSPKAYSKVKSTWANEALSNLPLKKQFDILDKMDITSAWRLLRTKPMPEIVKLLKIMQEEKVRSMLMLESLTHRKRIASQVGIDLGEIKDKEDVMPLSLEHQKYLKPVQNYQKPFRDTIPVTEAKMKKVSCIEHSEDSIPIENCIERPIISNDSVDSVKTNKASETEITTDNIPEKQSNKVVCRDSIIKCNNCEEIIGKLEITHNFKDYIVCNKCYQKLNTEYGLEG